MTGKTHLVPNNIDINEFLVDVHILTTETICGRAGFMFLQTFNFEVEYLLKNALVLFKDGYVDVAYYQLRTSLELSMVSVYLLFEHERQKALIREWKSMGFFPPFNKMIKKLKKGNKNFKEFYFQTRDYFEFIKQTNDILNKKVHKQGTHDYYHTRQDNNRFQNLKDLTPEFIELFKQSFSLSFLTRMIIDPMPLLLTDSEIYLRMTSPMAGPLRDVFIDKYNMKNILDDFKETDYYKEFYNHFIQRKKYTKPFVEFENFGNLDYKDLGIIKRDYEDLTASRKLVFDICSMVKNIISICFYGGFHNFIIDNKGYPQSSYLPNYEWNIPGGQKFEEVHNSSIETFYRSRLIVNERFFYINHQRELTKLETEKIRDLIFKHSDAIYQ